MQEIKKGRFIVIEGGDGSGKGTQTDLLITYLKEHAIAYAHLDFPNYDSFFGKLTAKFLRGELGKLDEISPYFASLPFALDRNEAKKTIQSYLDEGKLVVANRYVSSNMAHQGSKIENSEERKEFISWLEQLEYKVHGIPQPDLYILLYMPWQKAKELTTHKQERSYLNGETEDIQEADDKHRIKTEEMYTYLADHNKSWRTINCVENDTIISKEIIHKKIISVLQDEHII
ncbi:MAG TPA: thymidylate kinase [Candidatus Woesebacteria bacterium]|nr:thymidylate kinase [Candidatus Woesebacteria bacterium]